MPRRETFVIDFMSLQKSTEDCSEKWCFIVDTRYEFVNMVLRHLCGFFVFNSKAKNHTLIRRSNFLEGAVLAPF
jgi:hypothetical protein